MLLFLGKLVPLLVYPTGVSLLLITATVALIALKRTRAALWCGVGALAVLFVFSLPVTKHVILRSLESRYEDAPPPPACSTIVMLCGGEVSPLPPRRHPEINSAGDRLIHAARLYGQRLAPRVIITGGSIPFLKSVPEPEARSAAFLMHEIMGVDSSALIVEPKARTTAEHAPRVAAILDSLRVPHEIILVTSAMHMHRSIRVFEKAGFTVHPAPADFVVDRDFQWKLFQFIPRAGALFYTTTVLHEYYGIAAYSLMGWI